MPFLVCLARAAGNVGLNVSGLVEVVNATGVRCVRRFRFVFGCRRSLSVPFFAAAGVLLFVAVFGGFGCRFWFV